MDDYALSRTYCADAMGIAALADSNSTPTTHISSNFTDKKYR